MPTVLGEYIIPDRRGEMQLSMQLEKERLVEGIQGSY